MMTLKSDNSCTIWVPLPTSYGWKTNSKLTVMWSTIILHFILILKQAYCLTISICIYCTKRKGEKLIRKALSFHHLHLFLL